MNIPGIHSSQTGLQFINPAEPLISRANEDDLLDKYLACAQINAAGRTKKQEKKEDEKKYRWVFLAITLPFIIMAGLAYLFRKKDDPGGGPDGGTPGGNGPSNPTNGKTPAGDPPAISLRSLLTGWRTSASRRAGSNEFPGSQFMSAEGSASSLDAFRAGIDNIGIVPGSNGREFHRNIPSFEQDVSIENLLEGINEETEIIIRLIRQAHTYRSDRTRVFFVEGGFDMLSEKARDTEAVAKSHSMGSDDIARIRAAAAAGLQRVVVEADSIIKPEIMALIKVRAARQFPEFTEAPSPVPVPNLQPGMMGISATQIGPQTVLYNPALAMMNLPLTNIVPMTTGL